MKSSYAHIVKTDSKACLHFSNYGSYNRVPQLTWCSLIHTHMHKGNVEILLSNAYDQFAQYRFATRVRVEGRDHGGLGPRSRGERIGHEMEA